MLKKLFFIALLSISLFSLAYANVLPQPQIIGEHNIGELPHIGTLLCIKDNVQVAVYGDSKDLRTMVLFENNIAVFAVVEAQSKMSSYVNNAPDQWTALEPEAIADIETISKMHLCLHQMGLSEEPE